MQNAECKMQNWIKLKGTPNGVPFAYFVTLSWQLYHYKAARACRKLDLAASLFTREAGKCIAFTKGEGLAVKVHNLVSHIAVTCEGVNGSLGNRNGGLLGERIVEVLKQKRNAPVEVGCQVAIIYAVTHGFLDRVAPNKVWEYEQDLFEKLRNEKSAWLERIANGYFDRQDIDELEATLKDLQRW